MVTITDEGHEVTIPPWVTDINAFRNWADSDEFPEHGRISWLKGKVWVDMSREQLFTHNLVKTECSYVLYGLAKTRALGTYFSDGALISNFAADVSNNPDGMFVASSSLDSDRIRLIEGLEGGFVEIQGSPDMVLEILSKSSIHKDTVLLKQAYWEAGIREYWLIDARRDEIHFDIYRHTVRGYAATPKKDGWIKSAVFGTSFQLQRQLDTRGHPTFTLHVR